MMSALEGPAQGSKVESRNREKRAKDGVVVEFQARFCDECNAGCD